MGGRRKKGSGREKGREGKGGVDRRGPPFMDPRYALALVGVAQWKNVGF